MVGSVPDFSWSKYHVKSSSYVCPSCQQEHKLFGDAHIEKIAKEHGLEILAKLPMSPGLATLCDQGTIEMFNGEWLESVAELPAWLEGKRGENFPAGAH